MAYVAGNLVLMATGNGYSHYRYDTDDAASAVDASGYFNNSDDDLNMVKGDIIDVVVWTSAVRTSDISDVSKHIVVSVSAAGVVDLSNDLLVAAVSDTD